MVGGELGAPVGMHWLGNVRGDRFAGCQMDISVCIAVWYATHSFADSTLWGSLVVQTIGLIAPALAIPMVGVAVGTLLGRGSGEKGRRKEQLYVRVHGSRDEVNVFKIYFRVDNDSR